MMFMLKWGLIYTNTYSSAMPAWRAQPHLRYEGVAVFKAAKQTLIPALMRAQAVLLTVNRTGLLKQLISESPNKYTALAQ